MNGINNTFKSFFYGKSNHTENSKGTTLAPDTNKALTSLVTTSQELLFKRSEREVPENGQFKLVGALFDVPDSNNEALLSVGYDETNPKTQRLFRVGVRHQNSDQMTSQILKGGTKKEILDYLKDPKNAEAIKKSVMELSEYVDKNY